MGDRDMALLEKWQGKQPWEVLEQVLRYGESTELAGKINLSPQLVRGWRRAPESEDDYLSTGRKSPLERVDDIVDFVFVKDGSTERANPIGHHVARKLHGVFIPMARPCGQESMAMERMAEILKETGEAIEALRAGWFDQSPGLFTRAERERATKEIEDAIGKLFAALFWMLEHAE